MFATECLLTAPAVVSRLEFPDGSLSAGLGQPAAAVGACDHRDCLDWLVVLLRLSRQQPAQAQVAGPAGKRRGRRDVGGARRRLLQPAEVHGGAEEDPHRTALVLLGELLHLAVGLCAVHRALPVERRHLPGRQVADGLVAGGGDRGGAGLSGGVLAAVRPLLPLVRLQEERRGHRRRAGVRRDLHRGLGAPASCLPAARPSCWWAR